LYPATATVDDGKATDAWLKNLTDIRQRVMESDDVPMVSDVLLALTEQIAILQAEVERLKRRAAPTNAVSPYDLGAVSRLRR
jgi:hypothetical protein